jgi:hypothetical protein
MNPINMVNKLTLRRPVLCEHILAELVGGAGKAQATKQEPEGLLGRGLQHVNLEGVAVRRAGVVFVGVPGELRGVRRITLNFKRHLSTY